MTTLKPFKKKISVGQMLFSTGTWTRTTNTGIPVATKTAGAETTKVSIPIDCISQDGQFGVKLTSIKVPIRMATAALVSTPTAVLYKRNNIAVAAGTTNLVASTVTTTATGLTVTTAATDRLITVTVTTPALDWDSTSDEDYNLQLTFNCATTSALKVYDAVAYFSPVV